MDFQTYQFQANKMNIQELVRQHRHKWIEVNQYVTPNLADALDFMATEVAEAIEVRLRLSPLNYIRNNTKQPTIDDLATEIFDAIMMGCIVLDLLGRDLEDVAKKKLAKMDTKRGL